MIKIGLIGAGYWGKNYIKIIENLREAKLSWICDKYNETALEFPEDSKFTKNYQDILEDTETKAVIIATPEKTHYQIAKDALEAEKDVLVEKPMTCSSKDALELINLAEKNSRILMVGHTFIYNSSIVELKKKIQNGELGKLFYFESRRAGRVPIKSDISVMWNLAPHDISIINFLNNSVPKTVSAKGTSFLGKVEDFVNLVLKYDNNVSGFINVGWLAPKKIRETIVVGSKKMAFFDDTSKEKLKITDTPDISNVYSLKLEDTSPLENQCLHFLDCIKTRKQPLTDGKNGYEIVKILEAAEKSLETGKEITIKL